MDFMNLNQSAHGDREFGFVETRMGMRRKTVVGHWQDPAVAARIGVWARAAAGWHEAQTAQVARFGDNMREVAVTEGDKVEAQIRLGVTVNGYGVGDLETRSRGVATRTSTRSWRRTRRPTTSRPTLRAGGERRESLRDAARIEAGLRGVPRRGRVRRVHRHLRGPRRPRQLPGIAAQRLMADGYGFGAEGDWKTAALVRIAKVMSARPRRRHLVHGGLHLPPRARAGRWCSARTCSRSARRSRPAGPSCEIHPLSIGGKADPVRLVFTAAPGPASSSGCSISATASGSSLNEVELVAPPRTLPAAAGRARPVEAEARLRDRRRGVAARRRPAPHRPLTTAIGIEAFDDLAEIAGIELLVIDERHADPRRRERAALEPGLLPARRRALMRPRGPARAGARGQPGARARRPRRPHVRQRQRGRPRPRA